MEHGSINNEGQISLLQPAQFQLEAEIDPAVDDRNDNHDCDSVQPTYKRSQFPSGEALSS